MYIGLSLFLIALGAILTFAINVTVSGIDLDALGIILMIAGIIGLVVDLTIWAPRRRAARPGRTVVRERRIYDDPGI